MAEQLPVELSTIGAFVDYVAELATKITTRPITAEALCDPDADLVADWGLDSLSMLFVLDALSDLLAPQATLGFDLERMGTTPRSLYLYCMEALARPLADLLEMRA